MAVSLLRRFVFSTDSEDAEGRQESERAHWTCMHLVPRASAAAEKMGHLLLLGAEGTAI